MKKPFYMSIRGKCKWLSCSFLFVAIFFVAINARAETLRFTAVPHQSMNYDVLYSMVARSLGKELGMPVAFVPVDTYEEALELFVKNEVQMAWFGGFTGILARIKVPGSKAIAQGYEDQHFKTLFIANERVGIEYDREFPEKIRGLTLLFGSKLSTSGRLMPEFFIRENLGKPSNEVFKKVGFSGFHSKTIKWVEDGKYDIGAVNFKEWFSHLQRGLIDTTKVKVIWDSPEYPDYHFLAHGDINKRFGEGFLEKLQKAILTMNSKEKLLIAFNRSHFVRAENKDFNAIKEIALSLGLVNEKGGFNPSVEGNNDNSTLDKDHIK